MDLFGSVKGQMAGNFGFHEMQEIRLNEELLVSEEFPHGIA